MEADADLELNQLSGVESSEMHVPLTSKYGCQVLLATYKLTAILVVVSLLDSPKEINHNDKLLSTTGTSCSCLLC